MSVFRLFCFKQFFKVHVFCLAMLVIFRLVMNINFGVMQSVVLLFSTLCSGVYLFLKPFMITKDIYALMAILSCTSLSMITWRLLLVALGIDFVNMMYFFLSMLIFTLIIVGSQTLWQKRRKRRPLKKRLKNLRYLGWGFMVFLFLYQLVLSYLLRPNFLTVMALTISHANLLLMIWTYFDLKRLYARA